MSRTISRLAAAAALVVLVSSSAAGEDVAGRPFAQQPSWRLAEFESARAAVFEWFEAVGADGEIRAQAAALWDGAGGAGDSQRLLDLVCASAALVDRQARELVDLCSRPRGAGTLPDASWLADDTRPAVARHNLRLLFGRWLAQELLYDEAREQLACLQPSDVADPAGLLFYQAVVYHRMLEREAGLTAIGRLLENEPALPRRYVSVARLMQADLDGLKDDSLDHIARRMDDIRRRLDLGRAEKRVREVEDGVIASLDKLIEQMEQQQQAAAAAAAAQQQGGAQRQMPLRPLDDSRPMGGKGEGQVDRKTLGNGSGWGDLPPRERQEALQQIGKDFPAHYRDLVEQYFRNLATEGERAKK